MKNKLFYIFFLLLMASCGTEEPQKKKELPQKTTPISQPSIEKPIFNADSAYQYIQTQVDFGPRYPNNEAHAKCAIYLKKKLQSFGFETNIQTGTATTFNHKKIILKNIIGAYLPEAEKRVLLFAHWDTRPFADQDTKNRTAPILGANDGGSGVGVLLEIARQISLTTPQIGVDIIFFDAEDYGQPTGIASPNELSANTWCLGSQYWAKNPHKENYTAEYGILLDMVGAKNSQFLQEAYSIQYAPSVVQKIWDNAQRLGYGHYFINQQTGYLIDDHKFVNELAGVPSVDIIHYENNRGGFHPTWHTHADNMDIIDKKTLTAVGEVVLYTLYQEE